ncbi:cyclase family protein, partial [Streptomyces zinciresistens]|uniref:cyclase family protein n=1 Tax=Streptomyces zinciresistens TaxID=1073330 RepID=UPI0031343E18
MRGPDRHRPARERCADPCADQRGPREHWGTYGRVRAGRRTTGRTATPIDAMPLDWFLGPGIVLDVRGREAGVVDTADLRKELDRIGHVLAPRDIVLLHTGA